MDGNRPAPAWGAVGGPVAFVAAWAAAGALRPGYDPRSQPISRLAEQGSPTRVLMTAGFACLAGGLLAASRPLGAHFGRATGAAVAGTALATVGVALTPLHGDDPNLPHNLFAVAGYATLAAAPLLARRPLAGAGRQRWAALSGVAGVATAALLTATAGGSGTGLLQRLGLTAGQGWIAVAGAAVATGRLARPY